MSPKGGLREGAGRPRLSPSGEPLHPVTVWLTNEQEQTARDYGKGNVSAGVRNLLDAQRQEGENEK